MEIYKPNATEEDIQFLSVLDDFSSVGVEVKPLPDGRERFNTENAVYIVHANGDVVRVDVTGIHFVGRI